jgi:SAM-dependent methyltransferase
MGKFTNALWSALILAASGGSQNFLGAAWVAGSLKLAPSGFKRPWALRLLRASPHYFYRTPANAGLSAHDFVESEYIRNLKSRRLIIDGLIAQYLQPGFVCIDYGCGPGFLAVSVAPRVAQVIACDITVGVLACAATINSAPNISYRRIAADGRIPVENESVDFVYTFAVFQHLTDEVLGRSLAELKRVMKPGAEAVCHVVLEGAEGWKSEESWRQDRTLKGRLKWEMGMHCFNRSPSSLEALITKAGLKMREIIAVSDLAVNLAGDDIEKQHLCIIER